MVDKVLDRLSSLIPSHRGDKLPFMILNEFRRGIAENNYVWDKTDVGPYTADDRVDEHGSILPAEDVFIRDVPVLWVNLSQPIAEQFQTQTINILQEELSFHEDDSLPKDWDVVGYYDGNRQLEAALTYFQFRHDPPSIGIVCSPAMVNDPSLVGKILAPMADELEIRKLNAYARERYNSYSYAQNYDDSAEGKLAGEMLDQMIEAVKTNSIRVETPYIWHSPDSFSDSQELDDVTQLSVPLKRTVPSSFRYNVGEYLRRSVEDMDVTGLPENWNVCAQVYSSEGITPLMTHFGVMHHSDGQSLTLTVRKSLGEDKEQLLNVLGRMRTSLEQNQELMMY